MPSNGQPNNKNKLKIHVRPFFAKYAASCALMAICWNFFARGAYSASPCSPLKQGASALHHGLICYSNQSYLGIKCAVDCLSTCHRPRIFQDKCNVFRVSAKSRFHEAEAAWCRAVRPASGGWGLNKLPTCYLTGGQLTRAN